MRRLLQGYDSNQDQLLDANDQFLPNCDQLAGSGFGSGSDASNPLTYFGAADLGCVSSQYLPPMFTGKPRVPPDAMRKRALIDLPRPLYHRYELFQSPAPSRGPTTDGT